MGLTDGVYCTVVYCTNVVVNWKKNLNHVVYVMSWIKGQQDMTSVHYVLNMSTVSTDLSKQGCHWQSLSVHLWAFCNPPITQDMNDLWCMKGRTHHHRNFPYSFWTVVWVLLHPFGFDLWKEKGDNTSGLMSPLNDTIILTESSSYITGRMISPVFLLKTLIVGLVGVWTHDLPLGRPALYQLI